MFAYKVVIKNEKDSFVYEIGKTYSVSGIIEFINYKFKNYAKEFTYNKGLERIYFNGNLLNIVVFEFEISKDDVVFKDNVEIIASSSKVLRIVPVEDYFKISNKTVQYINSNTVILFDKENPDKWSIKTYNDNGDCIRSDDSDGHYCEYEFNNNGKPIKFSMNGNLYERFEYDNDGNCILNEHVNGNCWRVYRYDNNGNEIGFIDQNGVWGKSIYYKNLKIREEFGDAFCRDDDLLRIDYEYDKDGNETNYIYKTIYQNSEEDDEIISWEKSEFDKLGNRIKFEDSDGLKYTVQID